MYSFMIAEKYVPNDVLIKVAKAILRAQDIREESWNGVNKYNKSEATSAYEATKEFNLDDIWGSIIEWWLYDRWNESQEWAQEILSTHKI